MHPGSSPIGANIRRFGAPRPSWPGQAAWALLCHDRAMRKSIFNHRCTLIHTDDIGSTNARFAALRMAPDYICVHQCASVVEIACLAVRMPAHPERYVSAHGARPGHSSQHSAGGDGHDAYRSPSPGLGITRFSYRRIVGGHRICDNAPTYSSARAFPRTAAMPTNRRIMAVRQCRYAACSAYTFAFYQAHGLSIGEQYS
jgi:hypothetical protein